MLCCDWLIMIVVVDGNPFINVQGGQMEEFEKNKHLTEVECNSTLSCSPSLLLWAKQVA